MTHRTIQRILTRAMAAATALAAVILPSCIKDDIPYPHIQANITDFVVADQLQNARIDTTAMTVTVYLPEPANIYAVQVTDYAVTPGATVTDSVFSRPLDLSQPLKVNLFLYYDYEWTITASQEIERYFTFEGQVGSSQIDAGAHTVTALISDKMDIANVLIESIKLGAEGSTYSPDVTAGSHVDLSQPLSIEVTTHGHTDTWTVTVTATASSVDTERVDAWTNVAWVYGQGQAGGEFGVEYRLQGETTWTRAPQDWLTVDGGSFCSRLIHLSPLSVYEARAISGEDLGSIVTFTTGATTQCPNMDFDTWWLDGKIWCPWAEGGEPYWGTGNKGAATLGNSNTTPTLNTVSGSGQAAQLQTRFVGISFLGKLAAGNIFVGSYVRTVGTNGVLSMGRPFTERPTALRGYLDYTTAPISHTTTGLESLKGQPDTCVVWCALIDSPEPQEIRTDPKDRLLFNPNSDYVIAYGNLEFGQDVHPYTPFEIKLNYKATDRVPKYILITASASKYGDFFTGGDGATLLVDDFELIYDY